MNARAQSSTVAAVPVQRMGALRGAAGRFAWLTLAGLTLGGIIHILIVLAVPAFATRDAAGLLAVAGPQVRPIDPVTITDADPFSALASCGFDLDQGPLLVRARTGHVPLSLSLHQRGGGVIYAITDRAAIRGSIEFVVLTSRQLEERVANDDEGESVRELRVLSPAPKGIVVARALIRRPSDRLDAQALVAGVTCQPAP